MKPPPALCAALLFAPPATQRAATPPARLHRPGQSEPRGHLHHAVYARMRLRWQNLLQRLRGRQCRRAQLHRRAVPLPMPGRPARSAQARYRDSAAPHPTCRYLPSPGTWMPAPTVAPGTRRWRRQQPGGGRPAVFLQAEGPVSLRDHAAVSEVAGALPAARVSGALSKEHELLKALIEQLPDFAAFSRTSTPPPPTGCPSTGRATSRPRTTPTACTASNTWPPSKRG